MKVTRRQAALVTAAGAVAADGPTGFLGRLAATPRMVRDVLLGRWDGVGRGRVALMALALAYVVSPIDLLPEAVLTLPGLADDALVASWLVAAVLAATGAYREWESGGRASGQASASRDRVVVGELVPPTAG